MRNATGSLLLRYGCDVISTALATLGRTSFEPGDLAVTEADRQGSSLRRTLPQ